MSLCMKRFSFCKLNMKLFVPLWNLFGYISTCSVLPPFEHELENIATPTGNVVDGADNAPNNRMDTSAPSLNEGHFSDEPPEILRDAAAHNSQPDWGDTANDFASVHEQSVPSMSRNGNLSPIVEGLSVSGEASFPSVAHGKAPTSALVDDLDFLNTGTSLGLFLAFYWMLYDKSHLRLLSWLMVPLRGFDMTCCRAAVIWR